MTKYSPEFKLKIVREYLEGKISAAVLLRSFKIKYNLSEFQLS